MGVLLTGARNSPGADANARRFGETVLIAASKGGHVDVVKSLLAADGSVLAERDDDGRTALHWATGSGQLRVVELLLSRGADRKSKDYRFKTALDYAREGGHQEISRVLQRE